MSLTWTDNRVLSAQELTRLAAAIAGTYVVPTASGGAVTASALMTVAVAALTASTGLYVNGVQDTTGYAGGTTVIATADVTNPRRDYVWTDGAGAIGNTPGVAAANPMLPDLTAGRIALAEIYVSAGLTTVAAANIIDRRAVPTALTALSGLTRKYKTATQVFTTNTTYADVTASSGSFAFAIAANEVWEVEYWIPLAFGGTGGAKFQLTGPSAPTGVNVTGLIGGFGDGTTIFSKPFTAVTAFSSDIGAFNSSSAATVNTYDSSGTGTFIHIRARIINGANAGTVTLQAAQNSSNTTTTLGIGSYMRAEKVA